LAGLALLAAPALAQTVEKCGPVPGSDKYQFDISLPQAEAVKSVEISANGKPLGDRANVDLQTINDVTTDYTCDVLLVVDQSVGDSSDAAQAATPAFQNFLSGVVSHAMAADRVRQTMRTQGSGDQGATGPIPQLYRVGITTLNGAAYQTLASCGSDEGKLKAAVQAVQLSAGSQRVARGLQNIVTDFQADPADRHYIIFLTIGRFDDPSGAFDELTKSAKAANVKICPVGFNDGQGQAGFDALADVAAATQGFIINSERETAKGEFPLPSERISDLMDYVISGAKGTFRLPDVSFPATVGFTVKTTYGKIYNAEYQLNQAAAAPVTATTPATNAPSATVPSTNAPSTNAPSGTTPAAHPATTTAPATPAPFNLMTWINANPEAAAGIGLGAVIVIGLVIYFVSRRSVPKASIVFPENPEPTADDVTMQRETPAFAATEEPTLAWLVVGDNRYPLGTKPVRIGRKSDNDIVLDDDSVSQYHAEIVRRENSFVVLDRGSSNKVLISGRPVSRETLHDGDVIVLGEIRLRFELNS
jgi:hypothetical protein